MAAVIAAAGCTSLIGGKAPIREKRKFIIQTEPLSLTLPDSERPYAVSVEVSKFAVSRVYDRQKIVLRQSPEEIRHARHHSWAVRPSEMITDAVEGYLKDARLFTDIRQQFIDARPDYTLTGRVKSIERLDSGDQWYANLHMTMQLVNRRGEVMRRWDFTDEPERVYNADFAHTVAALKQVLRRYMSRAIEEMDFNFLVRKLQREERPYQHLLDATNGRNSARPDTAAAPTPDVGHPDYEIIPGKGQ